MAEEVNKGTKSTLQGPWPGPQPSWKKPLSVLLFLQHQQPRFAGFVSVALFIQDILENKITRHSGLCLWTVSGVGAKAGRYLECIYSKLILALINSLSPGSASLFLLLSYVKPKFTIFEMYKGMLPNGHYCHLLNHQRSPELSTASILVFSLALL